jgi:hypothetical protein
MFSCKRCRGLQHDRNSVHPKQKKELSALTAGVLHRYAYHCNTVGGLATVGVSPYAPRFGT